MKRYIVSVLHAMIMTNDLLHITNYAYKQPWPLSSHIVCRGLGKKSQVVLSLYVILKDFVQRGQMYLLI